jgi:tetratricopeptide (TPR) repeat protein
MADEARVEIGRYRVVGELGRGGFGVVYDAVHAAPDGERRVALKVDHQVGTTQREGRLGARLRHPGLVDVYEVDEHEGRGFLAMERCDGSLAALAPMPLRAVVEVGLAVCRALDYAHRELGLVHLDLKPANLLYVGGRVKVADLGIARARGFADGVLRGSAGFAAPEQRAGRPVDARTDVHALGVTLHALATGALPSPATVDLDGDEEAPDAGIGPLASVVERCTAPDPDQRYPSMSALAAALAALPIDDGPGLQDLLGPPAPLAQARLVGRDPLVAELAGRARAAGATALSGPPGVGKSVVAAAVARAVGRAVEVELVHATDADWVTLVASALGVEGPARELQGVVGRALAARAPILVVLDGCDRLASLAPTLAGWAAPGVHVLATAAAPLPGFDAVPVPRLSPEHAMALVVERAWARGVDVAGDADLPALVERFDHLPLALELAAGRLGVLTVRDLVRSDGLGLLRRGDEARHDTLADAFAWAWGSTDPVDRARLAALSAFPDRFSPAVARRLVGDLPDGALDHLAARGWLAVRDGGWRVPRSVREWVAPHRPASATRWHAEWVASADPQLTVADCAEALRFAERTEELELVARIVVGSGEPLFSDGRSRLVIPAARRVVDAPLPAALRSPALRVLGMALHRLGEPGVALVEEALRVAAVPNDVLRARLACATILMESGRLDEGLALVEAAVAAPGADPATRCEGWLQLGAARTLSGRPGAAAALQEARRTGDGREAYWYQFTVGLGLVALEEGRPDEARQALRELERRGLPWVRARQQVDSLAALLALATGRPEEAVGRAAAAVAAARESGSPAKVRTTLLLQARAARARGAPDAEVAALLREALEAPGRTGVLARAELAVVSPEAEARALLAEAEAGLRLTRRAETHARVAACRAEVLARAGDLAGAEAALAAAESGVAPGSEGAARVATARRVVDARR